MNRVISWINRMQLRQILTAVVVGLTFLVSTVVGQVGYALQAQASPMTPEARGYQVDQNQTRVPDTFDQTGSRAAGVENRATESAQGAADTVREKLNLDEPLPDSTKKFFKQLRGEDVEVHEQIPSGKS